MSKIVCDVCGTSYQDTAPQCPICGCVREPAANGENGNDQQLSASGAAHAPVRGGRYSKANVRKRMKANKVVEKKNTAKAPAKEKKNGGLIALAVVLLLAIVAVMAYIAIRFFMPDFGGFLKPNETTAAETSTAPIVTTTAEVTEPDLSCTDLQLAETVLDLTSKGEGYLINVTPVPADTEDVITYVSDDASIATVSEQGKVTAIAPGETVITVICGDVEKTIRVVCNFVEETTVPETTVPETTAELVEELKLNREDITMSYKGEAWQLYEGSIANTLITWKSNNESVATFKNGRVVAVGEGTTTVTAEYQGQAVSCIIRCSFAEETEETLAEGGFNTGVGEG